MRYRLANLREEDRIALLSGMTFTEGHERHEGTLKELRKLGGTPRIAKEFSFLLPFVSFVAFCKRSKAGVPPKDSIFHRRKRR